MTDVKDSARSGRPPLYATRLFEVPHALQRTLHRSCRSALGFSYDKVEGTDGIFTYDLELGALYHFQPVVLTSDDPGAPVTRVAPPYLRPFVGLTGFTGGDSDDNEFIAGVGLGVKMPWRRDLAIRLEANVGYGFDNEAARIGVLAGLSYFPR